MSEATPAEPPLPALTKEQRLARFQAVTAARAFDAANGAAYALGADGRWRSPAGKVVCGSMCRSGLPCTQEFLGPSRRCKMHLGWASTRRLQATGLYSRAAPKAIRRAYEALRQDATLMSLRDDVALVTARIAQALQGATSGAVASLPPALDAFDRAVASRDVLKIQGAVDGLRKAVKAATDEARAWEQIVGLQRHKGRLARTEHLRIAAEAAWVDAQSAWALVDLFRTLVRTHVTDTGERRAILDGLVRVVGRGATEGAGGGPAAPDGDGG